MESETKIRGLSFSTSLASSGAVIDENNSLCVIKHAYGNFDEQGLNLLVEGIPNKKIRVLRIKVWISGAVSYDFVSGENNTISSQSGTSLSIYNIHGIFEANTGEDLSINLSDNILVGIDIDYIETSIKED